MCGYARRSLRVSGGAQDADKFGIRRRHRVFNRLDAAARKRFGRKLIPFGDWHLGALKVRLGNRNVYT